MGRYVIEQLDKDHDRAAFSCGKVSLDTFIREQMRQLAERNLAVPYLLVDMDASSQKKVIAGYYTLSASALDFAEMPESLRHKLPRRLRVGITLLGRLAVDQRYPGQGLGRWLLLDALKRALDASSTVASRAILADALDEEAAAFYEHLSDDSAS